MDKIRVLIADDSVIYRSQIRAALGEIENIEVTGVASNGRIACDLLTQSKVDLLILDLEMPEMDGLQTLKEMRARGITGTKVLLFSSFSKRGAQITLSALQDGASDFIAKPNAATEAGATSPSEKIRILIEPKIRALFNEKRAVKPAPDLKPLPPIPAKNNQPKLFHPKIVVIGTSTGGPTVLETIFSSIRGPLEYPILIVQHMPPLFTAALAERIEKISGIRSSEARDGETIENRIYVAPGDYHMTVRGNARSAQISINKEPQENFVRPAVDPLFRTAAKVYGASCLGVVLTGMGSDGKLGAESIRLNGGSVIIQDETSSAVFGMPKAVLDAGHYDLIATPAEIISILSRKASMAS